METLTHAGASRENRHHTTRGQARRYVIVEPNTPYDLADRGHARALRLIMERAAKGELQSLEYGPLRPGNYTLAFVDERGRYLRFLEPSEAFISATPPDTRLAWEFDFLPDKLYESFLNESLFPMHRIAYRSMYGEIPSTLRPAIGKPLKLLGGSEAWTLLDDLCLGLPDTTLMVQHFSMRSALEHSHPLLELRDRVARYTREGDLSSEWPFWLMQFAHGGPHGLLIEAEFRLRINAPDLPKLFSRTRFFERVNRPTRVTYCMSWIGFLWHRLLLDLENSCRVHVCNNPHCSRTFTTFDTRQRYCQSPTCNRQRAALRQRRSRRRPSG